VRIDSDVIEILFKYEWPGNVRELRNIAERLVVLSEDGIIKMDYLPEHLRQQIKEIIISEKTSGDQKQLITVNSLSKVVREAEKQAIIIALNQAKQNRSYAAKLLEIPRSTLYYKLEELGFNKK